MNLKNWILFQKPFIFATKNWLWGKLLVYQIKKYKKSDFGHFQAFRSTRITTKTLNGHLIFCFQDRLLKFCMKAYLTNLNPRLRGIFDMPTFLVFGIVYRTLIDLGNKLVNYIGRYFLFWITIILGRMKSQSTFQT